MRDQVTKMELKKLYENTLRVFECKDTEELKNKLYNVVLNNEVNIYNEFLEIVDCDLSVDWMQKIFQYYEANRKEKMQDFTPKSLSRFVAKLAKHNEIIDMCAGSGALSIQKWNLNKDTTFILYEFDENVIPFLLFNLAVRNIEAKVYHMDVLSQEVYHEYRLKKQNNFSKLEVIK